MSRIDPYLDYNFLITLMDSASVLGTVLSPISKVPVAGFSECTGLEMSLDIEEYKEGGNNGTILLFPKGVKWTNLRLKRGLATSNDLWLWHYGFVQGKVKRHDGIITLMDEDRSPVKAWAFTRGLPVKWAGPAFNATQGQIAFEEIEIAHEGLKLL